VGDVLNKRSTIKWVVLFFSQWHHAGVYSGTPLCTVRWPAHRNFCLSIYSFSF
jgi:hypothetical protein